LALLQGTEIQKGQLYWYLDFVGEFPSQEHPGNMGTHQGDARHTSTIALWHEQSPNKRWQIHFVTFVAAYWRRDKRQL
jgi:hypothetical protein